MKHQIALVGGQLLPVYIGIKEFNPDKIHFIVSNETKNNLTILKPLLSNYIFTEYTCDAFDFYAIKSVCESIIQELPVSDTIVFNLTGGTKIMVLAAQAIIHERQLKGFYINQDDSILELPSYIKKTINTQISIREFFDLSGHHIFASKKISEFSVEDFKVAHSIGDFAKKDKRYSSITSFFRREFKTIPELGNENLTSAIVVKWDKNKLLAEQNGKIFFSFSCNHVIDLFFNAGWWELIVAEQVAKWAKIKEVLLKCELPFKSDKKTPKNEIDILLNTGKKLIFIECKSGQIKQEDINKMKIIRQTYGGVISKSILVSRIPASPNIVEKCKELDIELFVNLDFKGREINPLNRLMQRLDDLNRRDSI